MIVDWWTCENITWLCWRHAICLLSTLCAKPRCHSVSTLQRNPVSLSLIWTRVVGYFILWGRWVGKCSYQNTMMIKGAHYTIHWAIGWWVTRIIKLEAISGASGIWSWHTWSRYTGSDCEIYAMFTVLLQPGVHKVDYFCSPRWPNFFFRFTAACKT